MLECVLPASISGHKRMRMVRVLLSAGSVLRPLGCK